MNGGGHSANELKAFKRGNRKGQYLKMQTEATLTFHITPVTRAMIRKSNEKTAGEAVGQGNPCPLLVGEQR